MNGNTKMKFSDIAKYVNHTGGRNITSDLKDIQLSNGEVKRIIKDLQESHLHLKNFSFITGDQNNILFSNDKDYNAIERKFIQSVIQRIVNDIYKSETNSIFPTICAFSCISHKLGFIFGRNKEHKPYILHYDYAYGVQDTKICDRIAEQYKKKYGENLYILRVPQINNDGENCMVFQLMLMRYMKPEYIEKYMENAKPGINTIDLKDLPKKLLSYYQSRNLNKIAPELWEQNQKDGHIVKEEVWDEEARQDVLIDQNKKTEHKKQMLHVKYFWQRQHFKNTDEIDMNDIISKPDSEIEEKQNNEAYQPGQPNNSKPAYKKKDNDCCCIVF